MKIRVITEEYNYMGLYYGQEFDEEVTLIQSAKAWDHVRFVNRGKVWILRPDQYEVVEECRSSYCECEEGKCSGGKVDMRADEAEKTKAKGPIKSDGGSSSYYDLELPDSLLNSLIERKNDGKCYVKTEELISVLFDNDYDFGCAFKALVRAKQNLEGVGKAGNDLRYETNKVKYYADKIFEQGENK